MTAILISDAEWELLAGEPAELLKRYMTLKRRMDFSTGVAGIKTLINEIVLRDGFTVGLPTDDEAWEEALRGMRAWPAPDSPVAGRSATGRPTARSSSRSNSRNTSAPWSPT